MDIGIATPYIPHSDPLADALMLLWLWWPNIVSVIQLLALVYVANYLGHIARFVEGIYDDRVYNDDDMRNEPTPLDDNDKPPCNHDQLLPKEGE